MTKKEKEAYRDILYRILKIAVPISLLNLGFFLIYLIIRKIRGYADLEEVAFILYVIGCVLILLYTTYRVKTEINIDPLTSWMIGLMPMIANGSIIATEIHDKDALIFYAIHVIAYAIIIHIRIVHKIQGDER